jgi:hypothetical protein
LCENGYEDNVRKYTGIDLDMIKHYNNESDGEDKNDK